MAETPNDWPTNPFKIFFESDAGDAWRGSMLRQTERFWEAQRRLLDEYESFSRALIERRRAATEATIETMRKLGACRDNADWAKCCSDWVAGSFARVAADSRDMVEEGMKVFADVSQSMSAGLAQSEEVAAAPKEAAARGPAIAETAAAMQEAAARAAKAAPRFKKPEDVARL